MAKKNRTSLLVLTANDLLSGAVVWWTGDRWSELFADAQIAAFEEHDALEAVAKREEAANSVVGAIAIGVDDAGHPAGLRESHRLAGPSIPLPDETVAVAA